MLDKIQKAIIKIIVFFLNIYKNIFSPFFGSRCRHYPTCSEYTKKALLKYGLLKGLRESIKRIVSCNPFSEGRIDEIQERE